MTGEPQRDGDGWAPLRARVGALYDRAEVIRRAAGLDQVRSVGFPLRGMAEVFEMYAEGRGADLPLIDHARLAVACLTNYRETVDGREHPKYWKLLEKYAEDEGFVASLSERARVSPLLRVLLQTLVLGRDATGTPHERIVRTLLRVHVGRRPDSPFVADLLTALEDSASYRKRLAEQSIVLRRRPEQIWCDRGFVDDPFAWRVFLDPCYDDVLALALGDGQGWTPGQLEHALRITLDFGLPAKLLAPRIENAVRAAHRKPELRQVLFEYLNAGLGAPVPDWAKVPGVSPEVQRLYDQLRGFVEFRYFEMVAQMIHDHFLDGQPDAEMEKTRLRSRSFFWRNYGDQIEEIKIFLSAEKKRKIQERQRGSSGRLLVSQQFLAKIGRCAEDAEIGCLLVRDVLFVEYFRGASNHTRVIPEGRNLFRELARATLLTGTHLDKIRRLSKWGFRHRYLWQIPVMNFLADRLHIRPTNQEIWFPAKGEEFEVGYTRPRVQAMDRNSPGIKASDYEDYGDLFRQVVFEWENYDIWRG